MKNIGSYIKQKQKHVDVGSTGRLERIIDDQTVIHLFSRVVREEYGRQGEKNIVPKFIKNGVIFLQITNSIWAQEMWMRRDHFVHVINEKIGQETIKNIKIAT